jgi:cold shock CspA family protein
VRFDRRRGYGFVQPDDGGEDVFVHQNNINMEGFRFLQVGERVSYELEVGEKGMKAVGVALLEPRAPRPNRDDDYGNEDYNDDGDDRDSRDAPRRESRPPKAARRNNNSHGDDNGQLEKLRRKQERLISLLVEKGVLAPGEIDGLDAAVASGAQAQVSAEAEARAQAEA